MAYRFLTVAGMGCALAVGTAGCFNSPGDAPDPSGSTTVGTSTGSSGTSIGPTASSGTTSGSTTADDSGSTTREPSTTSTTTDPTGIASSSGEASSCDDEMPNHGELCLGPHEVIFNGRPTAALAVGFFSPLGEDIDERLDIAAGHDDGLSIHARDENGNFTLLWDSTADEPGIGGVLGLAPFGGARQGLIAVVPDDNEVVELGPGESAGDVFRVAEYDGLSAGPYNIASGRLGEQDIYAITQSTGSSASIANGFGMMPTTVQTGTSPLGLALARLNADESDDLVVANSGANTLSVFFSSGGAQSYGPGIALPAHDGPRGVGVGDFDGDGLSDIVAIHDQGTAGFWYGDGDGGLSAPEFVPIGAAPRGLAVADLDNDNVDDVAVALEAGNAVGILRGGDRAPGAPELFATMSAPTAIVAGDFNGDGAVDLATGSSGVGQGIAVILATP